ncbi:MAG: hypothetical protein US48_C0042G0002 [Candidatus Levybacteria bacterium GW2011_GWA2_37_36]|uniref:Uncharacterized protein n=1 Tax=Candidatus Roizmanbacteria bacterium GW2011_GWC2_34_23 TaxID=1618484 RepID=A0A0G0BCB4_9BACT|nr:MAG: hypothetical protein UR56_C0015G0012 [Candidatus Roizmanbacteria bacterium GW2011_GWC2_34_23]KKQ31923.1 MAG: hypothetical protein US48_C0042G0002 [Candidatus Levybacteria bacterium GW2011_GWA2_37_36]
MEKLNPDININAAFSFLTEWAEQPVTSRDNPSTGTCSLELPIAPPDQSRLKYICVGMLYNKGPFKFYKACEFNDHCPIDKYKPVKKIEDEPLEIEKKWAKIKAEAR